MNPSLTFRRSLFLSLFLIAGVVVVGLVVGGLIGTTITYLFFDNVSMSSLAAPMGRPELWWPLMVFQGSFMFFGFIVFPMAFIKWGERNDLLSFFSKESPRPMVIILLFLTLFSFMGPLSVLIQWNEAIALPEFMNGIEKWAQQSEAEKKALTLFLLDFTGTGKFIMALFVIAVLPAIGEEFLFRGILQTALFKGLKNEHVAIWFAAVLFSALHFQFYGFVPRMLLGALFGYLYVWSGNLLIPMIGHFINNAGALLSMFLFKLGVSSFDMENPEPLPLASVLILSFLFAFFLIVLRKKLQPTDAH